VVEQQSKPYEKLADKLFWAPVAALLATGSTSRFNFFVAQCIIAGVFV
jgi:hypothetical protein